MPSSLRVAVVTPYYRETPEILRHCHDSVRTQTSPCTHFLIADGHPQEDLANWSAQHIILAQSHGDVGDTPRCIGSLSAMNQGYDAIAYLDADNWYYPHHIETMIDLHRRTGAAVCTATRSIHRLDGSLMYVDTHECDGKNHVDTNCLFLTRTAFRVLPVWAMMPQQLYWYGDRIFWQALLARGLATAHHPQPTVAYRTPHQAHYRNIGEPAPPGTKSNEGFEQSLCWWRQLPVAARRDWSAYLMGGSDRTMKLGVQEEPVASAAQENNRGVQLLAEGRHAEAEAAFRRAWRLAPELPEVSFNIAKALQGQGRLREAEEHFLRAIRQRPNWAEAHVHLGFVYYSLRELTEAEASYRRALELEPDHVEALNSLGANILNNEGRIEEARVVYQQALALKPNHTGCHSNLVLNEQYAPGVTRAGLAEVHAEWERRHAASLRSSWRPFTRTRDPERPLRLGFVSGDFFYHPVGVFLAPVLERLARDQWFTVCYANQQKNDELTRRLTAAAGLWREVHDLSDEALAERIRADEIDLLVDLSGHTGRNRLLTFARRPAPVQLTWMGYVGTTGLSAIDYLIADRCHVPLGCEEHYREQVLRLPDGYLCYEPPAYAPPVGPLPALTAGHVTFGCFNNVAKITAAVVAIWSEILRRQPSSRLVLKYHWLDDAGLRQRLSNLFAVESINPARVEMLGSTTHLDQLKQYNRIDVALDSFPYAGGLTTCESCWMGVPVVTCPGETFASRHSLSHLFNIGLTETIANNLTEYVDKAVSLAGDLPYLADLRMGLRKQMELSPLCDCDRYTVQFAGALRKVWRAWSRFSGASAVNARR